MPSSSRTHSCASVFVFALGVFLAGSVARAQVGVSPTPAGPSKQFTLPPPTLPSPLPSDSAALALRSKALAALDGNTAVTDVVLVGSGTRTVGPDIESGTITLKALGARFSRVDLSIAGGTITELRGADANNMPLNSISGTDGVTHSIASHNAMTDAGWFVPQLTSLSSDPAKNPRLAFSYVGQEERQGVAVQHLHIFTQFPVSTMPQGVRVSAPNLSRLTAGDIYLDAGSALPVELAFNTHPDNNALVDIPVSIEYSNYQAIGGVLLPFRIQKFVNGTLTLDITIQSATVNSGLSAAAFGQ